MNDENFKITGDEEEIKKIKDKGNDMIVRIYTMNAGLSPNFPSLEDHLQKFVAEENYELASKLRDKIKEGDKK